MEEQFFLTACQKAVRWLGPLQLKRPEAVRFSEFNENIKVVRDEREHDDLRYGLGNEFDTSISPHEHATKGYIKNSRGHKFWMKPSIADGPVKTTSSMSCTTHSGGSILLGGVLDVAVVISAAEALLSSLLVDQHENSDRLISRYGPLNAESAKIAESYYVEPRFEQ